MESKIQQLTEAIYNEGVLKAQAEAETILKEARENAALIEVNARKSAELIINEAKSKSEELKKHVDSEMRMTLSHSLAALKQEIISLVTFKVVNPSIKEVFSDKEYLKKLITIIVKGWQEKESFDLNIIVPETEKAELSEYFKNSIAVELNKNISLTAQSNLKSGFKIGPADGSYLISFTEDDFNNFLSSYLKPKTSQILFEENR